MCNGRSAPIEQARRNQKSPSAEAKESCKLTNQAPTCSDPVKKARFIERCGFAQNAAKPTPAAARAAITVGLRIIVSGRDMHWIQKAHGYLQEQNDDRNGERAR